MSGNPENLYSGQHGRFYLKNSDTVRGNVRDWSVNTTMATLDSTTLGDTYKTIARGLRTISGTATIFWTSGDDESSASGTAHDLLTQLITTGDDDSTPGTADEAEPKINMDLRVDDGSDSSTTKRAGRGIRMEVMITSAQLTMAHGEIFGANIAFECIGAPRKFDL